VENHHKWIETSFLQFLAATADCPSINVVSSIGKQSRVELNRMVPVRKRKFGHGRVELQLRRCSKYRMIDASVRAAPAQDPVPQRRAPRVPPRDQCGRRARTGIRRRSSPRGWASRILPTHSAGASTVLGLQSAPDRLRSSQTSAIHYSSILPLEFASIRIRSQGRPTRLTASGNFLWRFGRAC